MKKYFIILGCIQAFIAIGAIPAGIGFLIDTSGGAVGSPTSILSDSPFSTFLIPGLFLLIVNGFGSAFGAFLSFRKKVFAGITGLASGVILCLWIILQVYWIGLTSFLQPLYLIVGVAEAVFGWLIFKSTSRIKNENTDKDLLHQQR
jgi:hypothetical protein